MALDDAFAGSINDSVILVKVRSLFVGRKFLTPSSKPPILAPNPASLNLSVTREERPLKPPNSWDAVFCAGCVGAEDIMVMRVSWRTVRTYFIDVVSAPAASRAWVKLSKSARLSSVSVVRYLRISVLD